MSYKEYISVLYEDKEDAKSMGAQWDKFRRQWYIPNELDGEDKELLRNKYKDNFDDYIKIILRDKSVVFASNICKKFRSEENKLILEKKGLNTSDNSIGDFISTKQVIREPSLSVEENVNILNELYLKENSTSIFEYITNFFRFIFLICFLLMFYDYVQEKNIISYCTW